MELLKIQYLKFIKASSIETETAWAPVNAAFTPSTRGPMDLARWSQPTEKEEKMTNQRRKPLKRSQAP